MMKKIKPQSKNKTKNNTKSKPRIKMESKKKTGITPLGDRVLIKPFTQEEVSGKNHFGIILPESMKEEKSAEGVVVAVGAGKVVDGKHQALQVKIGDRVIFSKYGYDEVTQNGEELYLLKEDQLLAIINN